MQCALVGKVHETFISIVVLEPLYVPLQAERQKAGIFLNHTFREFAFCSCASSERTVCVVLSSTACLRRNKSTMEWTALEMEQMRQRSEVPANGS